MIFTIMNMKKIKKNAENQELELQKTCAQHDCLH